MIDIGKIEALAKQKGVSIQKAEKEAGLGNGTIGKWKNASPRVDKLKKLSDYFGVSIEELIG